MRGTLFSGYLNEPQSFYPTEVRSGDLGQVDEAGFFHVSGRASNLIVSSYGRNISPEWVEARLLASGLFSQVMVFGEGKPYLSALLALRDTHTAHQRLDEVINQLNSTLPDYAHIGNYHLTPSLATTAQLLTSNGKLRRQAALAHFSHLIQPPMAAQQ